MKLNLYIVIILTYSLIILNDSAQAQWTAQSFIMGEDSVSFFSTKFLDQNEGWMVGSSNIEGNHGIIYHTTDGGENWTTQNSGKDKKLISIDFINQNRLVVVGDSGIVLISTDKGSTWIDKSIPILDDLRSVDMITETFGLATGRNGAIYKTTDGWESYTDVSWSSSQKFEAINFSTSDIGWVVGTGYSIKTIDGGTNWQQVTIDNSISFKSVFFINENTGFVAGSKNSGGIILKTSDGGNNWSVVHTNNSTSKFRSIYFINSLIGWVVGTNGLVVKTSDGGENWNTETTNTGNELFDLYFHDENLGWVAALDGQILKYENILPLTDTDLPTNLSASADGDSLVVISWTDNSDREDGFILEREIGAGNGFITLDSLEADTQNYFDRNVSSDTEYCYRLKIFNSVSNISKWDTTCATTDIKITSINPPTNLTVTANGDSAVVLNWKDNSTDEIGFQIERKVGTGGFIAYDTTDADIQQYIDTLVFVDIDYCYKVNAIGPNGVSINDTFQCVILRELVTAPDLISPLDNAVNQPLTLKLNWENSSGATKYGIQISLSTDFSTLVVSDNNIDTTEFNVSSGILSYNTTYYWRVVGSNEYNLSDWSNYRTFTTEEEPLTAPSVPVLTSPVDGAVDQLLTLTLDWEDSDGATTYGVQVSNVTNFSTLEVNISNLSVTEFDVLSGTLNYNTTYYWRANASNSNGSSNWSNYQSFVTEEEPIAEPSIPVLTSPLNGEVNQPLTLTLDWESSNGAISYGVQVSSASDFSTLNIDTNSITVSEFDIPLGALSYNQTYYWRVNANNSVGLSSWSDSRSFNTEEEALIAPNAPILSSPANGAVNQPLELTLDWESSNGATSYSIQISSDVDFASLLLDKNDLTSTDYGVDQGVLKYISTYYWRVLAKNAVGISNWSSIRIFVTEKGVNIPQTITVSTNKSFDDITKQNNYKMIGLPGDRNVLLGNKISGEYGTDWKAFYDNGNPSSYYTEYDGSSTFNFKPGNGFWIISKNNFVVNDLNIPNVKLNTDNTFSISLPNTTYNIISNPFDQTILWSNIKTANSLESVADAVIWSFSNGAYSISNEFNPYEAYYFKNTSGFDSLKIPYPGSKNLGKISNIKENKDFISLELRYENKTKANVFIGLSESASEGYDNLDIFAPPGDFTDFNINLYNKNIDDEYKYLMTEYRPIDAGGQILNLKVKSEVGKEFFIDFIDNGKLNNFEIYLIDHLKNVYNLRNRSSNKFTFSKPFESMSVLIGNQSFIDENLLNLSVSQYSLYQNYPNPFNPSTIIRYSLPTESKISLFVYNLIGEKVAELFEGNKPSGNFELKWNASNLASGVYFLRIDATSINNKENFQDVKKVILLK